MGKLRSRHIESWAGLGDSLYKGTWKSSTLACKFFAHSPALLDTLSFQELERFAGFLDALSHRSYDLASECLALGEQIFPLVGEDKDAFLSLASTLVDTGWREVKSFFEIRVLIISPLIFSLNKFISGGGPYFIPTTSRRNSL